MVFFGAGLADELKRKFLYPFRAEGYVWGSSFNPRMMGISNSNFCAGINIASAGAKFNRRLRIGFAIYDRSENSLAVSVAGGDWDYTAAGSCACGFGGRLR